MLAGYMRFRKNVPRSFFRLLTMYSCQYGVDLIYFTPEDININRKTVKGKMLINDQLIEIERRIPDFVDVSSHLFNRRNSKKYNKEIDFLRKNSQLSIDRKNIIKKDRLQKVLAESNDFSHLSIPTTNIGEIEGLLDYIDKNKKVVIKPVGGLQGKGVMIITKRKNGDFILGEQKQNKVLTEEHLKDFFNKHISGKDYVMQAYINSKSKTGEPIDCRIHLEKNIKGKWKVARKFIRIGIGQKVVSNISQGGCIGDVKKYLMSTFDNNWEVIYGKIANIEENLPYFIEKHENKQFMVMGLDVGIDLNGKVCIFEVNSFPIIAPQRAQVAKLRAGYYAYKIKSQKSLKNKAKKIKQTKTNPRIQAKDDFYKKEYYKLINSTSWKISKPIRKMGTILKKLKK